MFTSIKGHELIIFIKHGEYNLIRKEKSTEEDPHVLEQNKQRIYFNFNSNRDH